MPEVRPTPTIRREERPPAIPTVPPGTRRVVAGVRVRDGEGKPVPGAKVYLFELEPRRGEVFEAAVGAAGSASAEVRAPATYALLALADGFARGGIPGIKVGDGPPTELEVVLEKAAPISGMVRDGLTGRPLAGATVRAEAQGEPGPAESAWREAGIPLETTTAADGTYGIAVSGSGLYTVTASEKSHLPESRAGVRAGSTKVNFPLRRGGVVLVLVEQAGTWEPVAGAQLTIRRPGEDEARIPGAVTDASGAAVIGPLHEGRYLVSAEKENQRSHARPGEGIEVELTLTRTELVVNLVLRSWESGSIGGRVTGLDGEPISQAAVRAHPEGADDKAGVAVSDPAGAYGIMGLEPGGYRLTVDAPGRTALAQSVTLAPGESRTGVDFTLQPGFAIRGRVTMAAGAAPAEGCTVQVDGAADTRTLTGPDGSYELGPLASGTYVIRAVPKAYSLAIPGLRQVYLAAADANGVDIALGAGSGLRGEVRSATGPVSGAEVFLAFPHETPDTIPTGIRSATTDAAGRFELGGVQSRAVVAVAVRAAGYRTAQSPETTVTGPGWITIPPVQLEATGSWVVGTVNGLSGDPVAQIPVVVESNTFKRTFRYPGDGDVWWRWATVTNPDGGFRIGPLPAGEYQALVPVPPPLQPPAQRFNLEATAEKMIRFTLGEMQRVRNGVIKGRVRRLDDTLLPGIRISARSAHYGDLGATETDGSGNYVLAGLPQRAQILVEAGTGTERGYPELAPVTREVVAPAENVDFVLPESVSISGRVLGSGGRRVSSFELSLSRLDSEEIPGTHLPSPQIEQAGGGFIFRGLAPGEYGITARAPGWARGKSDPIRLDPGGMVSGLEIVLGEGATLRGKVVSDADGSPVAGARVERRDALGPWRRGEESALAITNGNGEFLFRHLSPGKVYLTAEHGLFAPSRPYPVEVPEGGDAGPVEIRLSEGAALAGLVTNAAGRPLAGQAVTIRGRGTFMAAPVTTVTDPEGRFHWTHLPEGIYDVRWGSISKQVSVGTRGEFPVVFRAAQADGY